MERRTFIKSSATAATVGLAGLAGCGGNGGGGGPDVERDISTSPEGYEVSEVSESIEDGTFIVSFTVTNNNESLQTAPTVAAEATFYDGEDTALGSDNGTVPSGATDGIPKGESAEGQLEESESVDSIARYELVIVAGLG